MQISVPMNSLQQNAAASTTEEDILNKGNATVHCFDWCYTSIYIAEAQRTDYLKSLGMSAGLRAHIVSRCTLFDDVMLLYQIHFKDFEMEYPFCVRFSGEKAIDTGGVARDMFSAFFEDCYIKLFDGGSLLCPAVHPHIPMSKLPTVGAIISHSYLTTGYLPIRIAFPCLAAILLGPSEDIPEKIFIESFINSLSVHEAGIFKEAFAICEKQFPPALHCDVLGVLSRYGCRDVPNPSNLKKIIIDVSNFEFIMKPALATSLMNRGIPEKHCQFWSRMSISELHEIYNALSVSSSRVLSMIEDPKCLNENQERVFGYLKLLIGNMNVEELQAFMRFVTGASVCLSKSIEITFNTLDGLARRPISHCCDCILELPVAYSTYPEFANEFHSILANIHDQYNWLMDSI